MGISPNIKADLATGSFEFGSKQQDKSKAEEGFLRITNQTLNDDVKGK